MAPSSCSDSPGRRGSCFLRNTVTPYELCSAISVSWSGRIGIDLQEERASDPSDVQHDPKLRFWQIGGTRRIPPVAARPYVGPSGPQQVHLFTIIVTLKGHDAGRDFPVPGSTGDQEAEAAVWEVTRWHMHHFQLFPPVRAFPCNRIGRCPYLHCCTQLLQEQRCCIWLSALTLDCTHQDVILLPLQHAAHAVSKHRNGLCRSLW